MKTAQFNYKPVSEFQKVNKRPYHKTKSYRKEHRKGSKLLSDYAKFHLYYLGFSFQNKVSGEVISKSIYYERFQDSYQPDWRPILFEPKNGWPSKEEQEDHFHEVAEVYNKYIDELITINI
jgi:hypothetical protein